MERVIDPIVADLQCEYGEALVRGTLWRARLSLVRSYLGLGSALIWLGMRYVCDPRISNPGFEVARTWIVSVLALASDGEPSDRLPALRPNAQTEAEAVGPSWDVTERQSCRRPRYRCLNGTTR
jgi:hypothetical protein